MKRAREWTETMITKLKREYPTKPTPELASELGKTVAAVKSKAAVLKIKKIIFSNSSITMAKEVYLKKHYANTRNADLSEILKVSEAAISARAFKLGLKKEEAFIRKWTSKTYFKKGHTPANKGKKQTEYMTPEAIAATAETRFKKGQVPHNALNDWEEVERRDKGGRVYTLIKVPKARKLQYKHIWLWEKHTKQKLKKGYNIVFKDGNTQNICVENLECISNAELMRRNSYHNYPKELAELIQLRGAVKRQINQQKQ